MKRPIIGNALRRDSSALGYWAFTYFFLTSGKWAADQRLPDPSANALAQLSGIPLEWLRRKRGAKLM